MKDKNINLEYSEINSKEDLLDAIEFLEDGFRWKKIESDLLKSRLPQLNKDLKSFGFMMKANQNIVGAMIFFHQGFLKIRNQNKPIINLSGWYINKEYRGIPTLTFLKHMLKKNSHHIFTNYSAKPNAEKIYLAVGFKKMKLKRAVLLISDCIFHISKIKLKDIHKDLLQIKDNFQINIDNGVGIKFLELNIGHKKIQLIAKKRILKRSILGIKFNWRTLTIIWTSNEDILSKHWKKISHKLLLHTKTVKVICDFYIQFPKNAQEKDNNYMLFSNDINLDYIPPIQSEMVIFD